MFIALPQAGNVKHSFRSASGVAADRLHVANGAKRLRSTQYYKHANSSGVKRLREPQNLVKKTRSCLFATPENAQRVKR
jgi:hypothetical protein